MTERVDLDPAYVLHTRPWRETSLIVDAFSHHHGRVGLVARGARRQTSAVKTRLAPFQPLLLSWFGKGELKTLHGAEWQGGALALRGHALMCGFYLNELLLRLLPPGDAHERLFEAYAQTLEGLSATAEIEPVLRRFELDLLTELGYAQPLAQGVEGAALGTDQLYGFEPGVGVTAPRADAPAFTGRTLLDLAAGDLSNPATLAEGKLLLRGLIAHYLGDKPLATRQLLIDLQKL